MWKVEYLRESLEDIKRLDQSQRVQVIKAIGKAAVNPLPRAEGGYGKPLSIRVASIWQDCKIKLVKLGLKWFTKL